jgi:amidophosphoribosyltransferase
MWHDNCGVFGIYSSRNCINDLWYGIFHLQHRGQAYCGISTLDHEIKLRTRKGLIKEALTDEALRNLEGNFGIAHVSLMDRQPIYINSRAGKFTIAFSGNIINSENLFKSMKARGISFSSDTDIELIAKLVGEGKDIPDGIERMSGQIKGSFSLVLLTQDGIYAARDPYAFKPLILGKSEDAYAVASESCSLSSLGMTIIRDLEAGEILFIGKDGLKTVKKLPSERKAHCAFEWAYFARLDSVIDGVTVKWVRDNLGAKLAKKDLGTNIKADIACPVPFSGIGHALGYHHESGIPYEDVFLYNRYSDRSYTPLRQSDRERIAKEKLTVIEESAQGRRVVLCDDSIVRGTQIRNEVKKLKLAGAREVHLRVASPPLVAPCKYGVSTRTYKELIAAKHNIDEIREIIGADTLQYNTLDDFVEAIGLPREDLCLACWTGGYPV